MAFYKINLFAKAALPCVPPKCSAVFKTRIYRADITTRLSSSRLTDSVSKRGQESKACPIEVVHPLYPWVAYLGFRTESAEGPDFQSLGNVIALRGSEFVALALPVHQPVMELPGT